MISFVCNVCGGAAQAGEDRLLDPAQPATCAACGSNARARSIVRLLSLEIFGTDLALPDFPALDSIRGLGLSDWAGYADVLEERFDYRNTFYHREPRFDIAETHPGEYARYDFIVASEVFEHVPPPPEAFLAEARRLLAPGGRLILTVPYSLDAGTAEHFPSLGRFALTEIDGRAILVNRRADGSLEVFDDLRFHRAPEGSDTSLELRVFSRDGLDRALRAAGFAAVEFRGEACLARGIVHREWSQPVVARAEPAPGGPPAYVGEMARRLASLLRQGRAANESRWSRLGRRLGVGPTINLDHKVEE